jgi:hypothetical protein
MKLGVNIMSFEIIPLWQIYHHQQNQLICVVERFTLLIREVAIQISARRLAILAEVFRGFSQSLQENTGILP